MDEFKRYTVKNYTAWDINCKYVHQSRGLHRLSKVFNRTARRKLKKDLTHEYKCATIEEQSRD